jgi:hypothetical protein
MSKTNAVEHFGYLLRSALSVTIFLLVLLPGHSSAEWYVGGYGGYSRPSKLSDVRMPTLGDRQATASRPFALDYLNGDTQTSSLSASDISLKSSGIFGAKAGYFFTAEGWSWLGVEIEAFTTTPTIKSQTITTQLDAIYTPRNINLNPPSGPPIVPTEKIVRGTLRLDESPLRLITVAANVIVRYPGSMFQPYLGVGVGAFYFFGSGSGQIDGRQMVPGLNALGGVKILATKEWGFFIEGKYNRATLTTFDPVYGLGGTYSTYNVVGGVAYHF